MKPLVSIITITRNLIENNREKSFKQCVRSIDEQDYPLIEHLIIDGASTDGTLRLFNQYKKANRKIISEPDTGIYNAMNKGLKKAAGKYILYLNSDDFFCRADGVSHCVAALEKAGADFCFAPCRLVHEADGRLIGLWEPAPQLFFLRMPFSHQALMVKKTVMRRLGGFDESFRLSGDYDFIIRMMLSGASFVRLSHDFVSFRLGGLSEKLASLSQKECLKCFEKNYQPLAGDEKIDYYGFFINKKVPLVLKKALQNQLTGQIKPLVENVFSKALFKEGFYHILQDVRHLKCAQYIPSCIEVRYYLGHLLPFLKKRIFKDKTEIYFAKLKIMGYYHKKNIKREEQ